MIRKMYNTDFTDGGSTQPEETIGSGTAAQASMSMEDLEKEIAAPRQVATDTIPTPAETLKPDPGAPSVIEQVFQLAPPPETKSEATPPQPVFPTDEEETEEVKADQGKSHALTATNAQRKLNAFLKVRDKAQSRLFAAYSGADRYFFEMDDEDYELLTDVYLPIMEEHGGKIPWWLDIALAESIVLGSKIQMARKLGKLNAENAALRNNNAALETKLHQAQQVVANTKKERTRFSIDQKGFYLYSVTGTYQKAAKRTDKASLNDIEKIAEVNDAETVKAAFGLSDEEIAKLYPDDNR